MKAITQRACGLRIGEMAAGPTLPPQAYTREILTSAFNWLQTQPDSVRKLATTPDALVGLYTRAKRFGNSSLEADAPVSSQNFMNDLKNLAEGLKQFESPTTAMTGGGPPQSHLVNHPSSRPPSAVAGSHFASAGVIPEAPPPGPQQISTVTTSHHTQVTASTTTTLSGLNERSRAMIQEVKSQMNLSSDAETINMMVALAYKSLKSLLG